MGFINQTVKHFSAFLVLLILLAFLLVDVSSSSNPSTAASRNEIPPKIKSETSDDHDIQADDYPYQVLRFKNIAPFFLNELLPVPDQVFVDNKKRKIRKMMKHRRRKNMDKKSRPFFVMLPKGFVPPSGSSPCHNDNPDSSVAHALTCGFWLQNPSL